MELGTRSQLWESTRSPADINELQADCRVDEPVDSYLVDSTVDAVRSPGIGRNINRRNETLYRGFA